MLIPIQYCAKELQTILFHQREKGSIMNLSQFRYIQSRLWSKFAPRSLHISQASSLLHKIKQIIRKTIFILILSNKREEREREKDNL